MENESTARENAQTSKTLQKKLRKVFRDHGIHIQSIEFESLGEGQGLWTMAGESYSGPSAYVYENGQVIFFDQDGNQIPALQEKGENGLRDFFNRFPEAELFICENGLKHRAENPEEYIPPEGE